MEGLIIIIIYKIITYKWVVGEIVVSVVPRFPSLIDQTEVQYLPHPVL